MASFGRNVKVTVDEAQRELTRSLFRDALGCTVNTPKPDLEVYVFDDGCGLGAYYVGAGEALSAEQQMKAPWLEFRVKDPANARRRLEELGIRPFPYVDETHSYFCPPGGGPVFRLAKLE